MKILIVEDDISSRVYLERALTSQGYSIESAANGVIALEKAGQSPPDLIISDIMMPEMDGFELCRRVKTNEKLCTIPVVFYTATYIDPKDQRLAISLGASRFLIKPMEPDDFFRAIKAVINEHCGKSLEVPLQPLAEMKELDRMQLEVLARKLDKKVRELEEEREALRKAENELKNEVAITSALLESSKVTSGKQTWDDITYDVTDLLRKVMGSKSVFIFMASKGILLPQSESGLSDAGSEQFLKLCFKAEDISCFKNILVAKSTLMLKKSELGEFGLGDYSESMGLHELLLAPIIGKEEVLGIICVNFDELPSGVKVVAIIEGIARQLSVAYDKNRLYTETQNKSIELARSLENLKLLSEIDKKILSTLNRDEVMAGSISQITRVVPADIAGILLLDRDTDCLRFSYGWSHKIKQGDVIPLAQCSGYPFINTDKTLIRNNLMEEDRLSGMDRDMIADGIKSDIFVPIVCKGKGMGLFHVGSNRIAGFTLDDVKTVERLASQLGVALENANLLSDLEDLFIATVSALASAIDAKSPWTKGHSERVTKYALQIAEKMGLGKQESDNLRLAGLLHDIGKIGTYDVILDKTGKLTDAEFDIIKKHPEVGANILSSIKQLKDIIPGVRHHHEHWNGRGYPDGLKSEEIPLFARILCIADSFDSMTADRPYRPSYGLEYAVSELKRCSGVQFDPELVEIFLKTLKETS